MAALNQAASSLLIVLLLRLLSDAECLPTATNAAPQPSDRVGIVGAGPSGLHMAYLLRSLGYNNLLLIESSGRVGGRSVTWKVSSDSLPHELGTCYVSSDYEDLRRMARGINYRLEEATLPPAVIRKSASSTAGQMNLMDFVLDRVRRIDPALSPDSPTEDVAKHIQEVSARYLLLRSRVFPPGQPDYLEFPLVQPAPELMSQLNCSLLTYLETNKLLALEPYFLLGMTAMGYGSPSDTSAIYGLMWMTQEYLNDLLVSRPQSKLGMLRNGFQAFWEAAADHLKLAGGVDFRMNSRVVGVNRGGAVGSGRPVTIRLSDGRKEMLDWLVWTPSTQFIVEGELFEDLTVEEAEVFSGLRSRSFRTKLVQFSGQPAVAADPVAYYLDQLDTDRPNLNSLMAVRNTELALNPLDSTAASDNSKVKPSTLVAYYLSGYNKDSDKDLRLANEPDPIDKGVILTNITFAYMPRYSIADMANGVLWRLLRNVQGVRRTWFAGHSVCFDSVKSVMKYNKMLLLLAFPSLENRLKEI